MSGENIVVFGTAKTLEASGAAVANGAVIQADDATYGVVADGGSFPDAVFALVGTFATAPVEGAILALYAQVLDIDGTLDTDVPEATRPGRFIGAFPVNNTTIAQPLELIAYDLPRLASYYVHNNGTGQSLSAGWTLKVTPRSNKAAP
jgi:hypothetical protein